MPDPTASPIVLPDNSVVCELGLSKREYIAIAAIHALIQKDEDPVVVMEMQKLSSTPSSMDDLSKAYAAAKAQAALVYADALLAQFNQ